MKKVALKIFAAMFVFGVCISIFSGCSVYAYPENFTMEEHIQKISEGVEKKYLGEGSDFTGYSLYPLYDENDKLTAFLVELEPYGFDIIKLNAYNVLSIFATDGMYLSEDLYSTNKYTWNRYRIREAGCEPEFDEGINWGHDEYRGERKKLYELDGEGKRIEYNHSPYTVAGVLGEKMYFLNANSAYITSIKRDGRFFNLVSMEEFEYQDKEYYKLSANIPPHISIGYPFAASDLFK